MCNSVSGCVREGCVYAHVCAHGYVHLLLHVVRLALRVTYVYLRICVLVHQLELHP